MVGASGVGGVSAPVARGNALLTTGAGASAAALVIRSFIARKSSSLRRDRQARVAICLSSTIRRSVRSSATARSFSS
jgi:hypothetical protein